MIKQVLAMVFIWVVFTNTCLHAQSSKKAVKPPVKNTSTHVWLKDENGTEYRAYPELRAALKGYQLVKYSGTGADSYGGASSTTKFTFCSDGTFSYYAQSSVTAYANDGSNGTSISKEEDNGTWKAFITKEGVPVIEMYSNKQKAKAFMPVDMKDGKTMVHWYGEWQRFYKKWIGC